MKQLSLFNPATAAADASVFGAKSMFPAAAPTVETVEKAAMLSYQAHCADVPFIHFN